SRRVGGLGRAAVPAAGLVVLGGRLSQPPGWWSWEGSEGGPYRAKATCEVS
ncbi:MAG: hypothetical protein ACI81V_001384, partial [Lentimonas sp.]